MVKREFSIVGNFPLSKSFVVSSEIGGMVRGLTLFNNKKGTHVIWCFRLPFVISNSCNSSFDSAASKSILQE